MKKLTIAVIISLSVGCFPAANAASTTMTTSRTDSALRDQVSDNTTQIGHSKDDIMGLYIANAQTNLRADVIQMQTIDNTGRIDRNIKGIKRNEQDIKDIKKSVKNLGAGMAANSNLHYNANQSGYAVAVGEYQGSTAIAGGTQFRTGSNTAVTLQVSYDGEGTGASVGFHGNY